MSDSDLRRAMRRIQGRSTCALVARALSQPMKPIHSHGAGSHEPAHGALGPIPPTNPALYSWDEDGVHITTNLEEAR